VVPQLEKSRRSFDFLVCIARHTFVFLKVVESLLVLLEGFGLVFGLFCFALVLGFIFLALGEAERMCFGIRGNFTMWQFHSYTIHTAICVYVSIA